MCHLTGMAKVSTWRLMDEHIGDCSYYMADIEPHHRGWQMSGELAAGSWLCRAMGACWLCRVWRRNLSKYRWTPEHSCRVTGSFIWVLAMHPSFYAQGVYDIMASHLYATLGLPETTPTSGSYQLPKSEQSVAGRWCCLDNCSRHRYPWK